MQLTGVNEKVWSKGTQAQIVLINIYSVKFVLISAYFLQKKQILLLLFAIWLEFSKSFQK